MPFLIIFFILPLTELLIFIAVSDAVGLGTALILTLFSTIAGGTILRRQGLRTLSSARLALAQGRLPLDGLFDGICLAVAGALLMAPGFLSDALGIFILIPAARNLLRRTVRGHTNWTNEVQKENPVPRGPVIEGEYERLDRTDF